MLVADRQAQQRGLAAHRRGPRRVGRPGPPREVEQLVAGLGGLAAPHLHAALQVAGRRDQGRVVGLDQGQVEQRRRRRDVAGGLRGQRRLQQPADAGRARRAQPRRTSSSASAVTWLLRAAAPRAAAVSCAATSSSVPGAAAARWKARRSAAPDPAPAVHRGERPVRRAFPARRGRVVDRATDERVAEVRTGATGPVVTVVTAEEVGGLGRLEVADPRSCSASASATASSALPATATSSSARRVASGSPPGAARRRAPAGC